MKDSTKGNDTEPETVAREALACVLSGLQACISTAQSVVALGNTSRAAGYVLGALDDLAPELAILATLNPPNR